MISTSYSSEMAPMRSEIESRPPEVENWDGFRDVFLEGAQRPSTTLDLP